MCEPLAQSCLPILIVGRGRAGGAKSGLMQRQKSTCRLNDGIGRDFMQQFDGVRHVRR
jgi:hypothetical protein